VPLPRLRGIDEPEPADLDAFSSNLAAALAAAVRREPAGTPPPEQLAPFTWDAVFARVEAVWRDLSS